MCTGLQCRSKKTIFKFKAQLGAANFFICFKHRCNEQNPIRIKVEFDGTFFKLVFKNRDDIKYKLIFVVYLYYLINIYMHNYGFIYIKSYSTYL